MGPTKFWFRKNLVQKISGPEKFVSKKIWVQQFWIKEMLVQKIWFPPKRNYGKFFSENIRKENKNCLAKIAYFKVAKICETPSVTFLTDHFPYPYYHMICIHV